MITAMRTYRRALQVGLFVVILAFIVTSMVVFGSGGRQEDPRAWVARVNGEAISPESYQRRYQEFVNLYTQSSQGRFTPQMAERFGVPLQVLDDLVQEALVVQRAQAEGFGVTDEELNLQVHGMQMFQDNGRFSLPRYEAIVRRLGFTQPEFEEDLRRRLLRLKVENAIRDGIKVSDAEVEEAFAQRHEQVRAAWALVEVTPLVAGQGATDQELETYLKEHALDFREPERRRVEYVTFVPKDFSAPVAEGDVEAYYRDHRAEFEAPPQVRVAHVLLRAPESGPAAEQARAKAADILKRAKAGEDFANLARELSQDRASAKSGGDVGWISRGEMEPPFDQAVFALKKGDLAPGPVQTSQGFHVIKATDVRPGGLQPLKDVASRIRERLAAEAADKAAQAKAEEIRPKLQAATDFMAEARSLGLSPVASVMARREALPGAQPDAMEETAFGLAQNGVSPPVRTPAGWVVLRALERMPAAVPPLAEIRDKVMAAVKRHKADAEALERATKLVAEAKQGSDLAAAAKSASATTGQTALFSRTKPAERLPGDAMVATLQTPAGGITEPVKTQQGYYVLKVLERVAPDMSGLAAEREAIAGEVLARKQSRAWAAWVGSARATAKIEVSPRFQPRRG